MSEEETRREISRLRQESLALDLERARKGACAHGGPDCGGGAVMAPADGLWREWTPGRGGADHQGRPDPPATGSLDIPGAGGEGGRYALARGISMSVKRNGVADEPRMRWSR